MFSEVFSEGVLCSVALHTSLFIYQKMSAYGLSLNKLTWAWAELERKEVESGAFPFLPIFHPFYSFQYELRNFLFNPVFLSLGSLHLHHILQFLQLFSLFFSISHLLTNYVHSFIIRRRKLLLLTSSALLESIFAFARCQFGVANISCSRLTQTS